MQQKDTLLLKTFVNQLQLKSLDKTTVKDTIQKANEKNYSLYLKMLTQIHILNPLLAIKLAWCLFL